jgi:hypothetical protein
VSLTVLVPTRGRPANAARLVAAFEATCVLPDTTVQFGVDSDDPMWHYYCQAAGDAVHGRTQVTPCQPSRRRGMVDALNQMWSSRPQSADVFGFMGDDHLPVTPGWDEALCAALAGKPAALAYGNDLFQCGDKPTAVVMTASIPRALGYMAPPELAHLFVDDAWLAWGRALDAITYLPDVVIEHLHPDAGKVQRDHGYDTVNAPAAFSADHAAYLAYRDGHMTADVDKLRSLGVPPDGTVD